MAENPIDTVLSSADSATKENNSTGIISEATSSGDENAVNIASSNLEEKATIVKSKSKLKYFETKQSKQK